MSQGDCRRDRHPGNFLNLLPNLLQNNKLFPIFAASISFIKNEKKEKNKKFLVASRKCSFISNVPKNPQISLNILSIP